MAPVVSNLRKFFRRNEGIASFKQYHYLNTLPEQQLSELLQFSELRQLPLSNIQGKRVLLIGPHTIAQKIGDRKPACFVEYGTMVRGSNEALPFRKEFFDVVFFPRVGRETKLSLEQVGELLPNGGKLILSVVHPALELLLYQQNPSPVPHVAHSIAGYFQEASSAHFYLEDLRESTVDLETKPFFMDEEEGEYYEQFKNVPLVLILQCVRYVKKG